MAKIDWEASRKKLMARTGASPAQTQQAEQRDAPQQTERQTTGTRIDWEATRQRYGIPTAAQGRQRQSDRERNAALESTAMEAASRGMNRNGYASMADLNAETNDTSYRSAGGAAGGSRQTAADSRARLERLKQGLDTRAAAAKQDADGTLRFTDNFALADYRRAVDAAAEEEKRYRDAMAKSAWESAPQAAREFYGGSRGRATTSDERGIPKAMQYAMEGGRGRQVANRGNLFQISETELETVTEEIARKQAELSALRPDDIENGSQYAAYKALQNEIEQLNDRRSYLEYEIGRRQAWEATPTALQYAQEGGRGLQIDFEKYPELTPQFARVRSRLASESSSDVSAKQAEEYASLLEEIQQKQETLSSMRPENIGNTEEIGTYRRLQAEIEELNQNRLTMERETPALKGESDLDRFDRTVQGAVDTVFGFDPFRPLDDWDREMDLRTATGGKNEDGRNASIGDIIGGAIVTGMADFNKQVASGLDFLLPTDFLGEYDPASWLNDRATQNQAALRARQEYALEDRSRAAKIASEVGSGTVAALPQAITALLSLPAAGIQSTAALAPQASGLANTFSQGVKAIARNPGYWQSFLSTVGGEYEDAKAQGGEGWNAAFAAIVSAMLNSVVEVGGGIQTLPGNLQNPGTSALLEWFKSGLDEGKEEVIQSLISGVMQKAMVDNQKPVFSLSDENAVVNPLSLAEDFGMGAAVGWTLGGGEALLTGALNRQGRRARARAETYARPVLETQETVQAAAPETHGQEAALLEKHADAFGESGKKAMMAAYTPGQNVEDFYAGFAAQYQAGLTGRDGANARTGNLTQAQQYAAYTAGQNDARASLEAERRAAQFAPVAGKDSGLVYDSFVKEAIKSGREIYRQVNDVAKALGVRVQFVDSVTGGEANADIQGADILIEKNNPNPVQYLAGHEFTHRIQDLAPNEYRDLRNYVGGLEDTGAKIDNLMDLYRRRGRDLSYEQALDEVTANYAGQLFENSQTVDQFIRDNYGNKGLLQQVRDFIRKIVDKLTGRQKVQATESEQKLTAALEAAAAAAQAMPQAQQNAAQDGRTTRYSINEQFSRDIQEWDKEGQPAGEQFILGSTGPVLQGLGAIESDIYMNGDKINTILEKHPEMTIQEIQRIPEILEDPVLVLKSRNPAKSQYGNSRLVMFGSVKAQDGLPVMCVLDLRPTQNGFLLDDMQKVTSAYTKDTNPISFIQRSEILHADTKRTIPLLRDVGFTRPASLLRNGSMGSISYSGKSVNIIGEKFSDVVNAGEGETDIRYSLKGEEELLSETRKLVKQAKKEGWSDAQLREARMAVVDRVYQQLVEEYGTIKPGEKPARAASVPRRTSENEKVSQTVRTILEAKATPETAIPSIRELVAKGDFSYETITDKAAIARAEETITDKNWGKALRDWTREMNAGRVTKNNTALGWALYNNAAGSGNLEIAMDILQQMVKNQRSAAQALQATRILKKLSPEGQLYGVVQSVEGLQKELNKRYGDGKVELKIDEDLAKKLLEADGQEARDAVLQDIYRDIGRQMPSRFIDKWNAWRYLSMLGNPRTHSRNIFGNLFFAPVVAAKDLMATGIEAAVSRVTGGNLARNKGLKGVGKLLPAAWADYANIEEAALGGGKYGDLQNANKYIEEGRKIYPGRNPVSKALEAARKANSRALDAEDVWFSKPHYAFALAQFCAAHKITEAEIRKGNDQVLAAARNYAIKEAQKATYRDANALSQTVSSLGKNRGRFLGTVMEGILPFRKTPANILARGLEYSPLGLIKGLSHDLAQVHKGNMTGAEAIDNISAGLTGTGLMALGAWLAAEGLVRGIGAGDDKERELEKLQGHQDYALELPSGASITLDWLAPEALPFFVGVNLWEATHGSGQNATLSQILNAVGNVSEPMLEMSFLQSLNDLLESGGKIKSGGLGAAPAALASAATSYLTQAFPTLLGQIERTGEAERETTYTGKNAFLTEDMQYLLGKVSGKIPGWDYQQIPYIDAWGRHESSGNFGERALGNFVNPAYTSEIEETPVEKELLRLYKETGDAAVMPSRAGKYFMADGKRRDLTAQEYVRYAEKKGQTALKLVSDLTKWDGYQNLEDGVKTECVKDAYTYANQTARHDIDQRAAEDSWVQKAKTGETQYKLPVSTYILLRNRINDIQSLKDADGETISNSKSLLIMQAVYNWNGLTDAQREFLFESFDVGSKVRSYNLAAVEEALQQMRSQQGKKGA